MRIILPKREKIPNGCENYSVMEIESAFTSKTAKLFHFELFCFKLTILHQNEMTAKFSTGIINVGRQLIKYLEIESAFYTSCLQV